MFLGAKHKVRGNLLELLVLLGAKHKVRGNL